MEKASERITRIVWIIVILLCTIGIGLVARRLLIISGIISAAPAPSPGRPSFGADFNMPPLVTILHIIPGLLFMILGPLQFVKKVRFQFIRLHRLSGRVFVAAAYLIGLSAIIMPFVMLPVGGLGEAVGSVFFCLVFPDIHHKSGSVYFTKGNRSAPGMDVTCFCDRAGYCFCTANYGTFLSRSFICGPRNF